MNRLFLLALAWAFALPVFSKTLFFQNDTVPPVVVCPVNDTVVLAPGACSATVNYNVLVSDDNPGVLLTQTAGLPSGSEFPWGVTINNFTATDTAGNTVGCSFQLTLEQEFSFLACEVYLEVMLDSTCNATVTIDMMLLDNPTILGCSTALVIGARPIASSGSFSLPPVFDADDAGEQFLIRVRDTLTGNSCWAPVVILSRLPELSCTNLSLPCFLPDEHLLPAYLRDSFALNSGFPALNDGCGDEFDLQYADLTFLGTCDSAFTKKIHRTWTVTDNEGNTHACQQNITLQHNEIDDLVFPNDTTLAFECNANWDSTALISFPYAVYAGKKYPLNEFPCILGGAQRSDTIFSTCGGSREVRRIFDVLNWCTGEFRTDTQRIFLSDLIPPVLECDSIRVFEAGSTGCNVLLSWPDVPVTDACSGVTDMQVWWEFNGDTLIHYGLVVLLAGDTVGTFNEFPDFPAGETLVTYEAFDACGQKGTCRQWVQVWDNTPPTVACKAAVTAYLDSSGIQNLTVAALVQDASDDCTPLTFKVRRNTGSICDTSGVWTDNLWLCCAELNANLSVSVRAYDVPVPPGIVPDSFAISQSATCQLSVVVADTVSLHCIAPPDTVVSCFDLELILENTSALDLPCSVDTMVVGLNFNDYDSLCSRGSVVRYFTVTDAFGATNQCTQTITVQSPNRNFAVMFPDDIISLNCMNAADPMVSGMPIVLDNACSLLDISYEDVVFTVAPDACLKVERIWTVLDRCLLDSTNQPVAIPNPMPSFMVNAVVNLPGPIVSAPGTAAPWTSTVVKINATHPNATDYSVFWNDTIAGFRYTQIIKIIDNQDPVTINCATDTLVFTDTTANDALLWNDSIWGGSLARYDKAEDSVQLFQSGTDVCIYNSLRIISRIFLDLDNNGSQETVVSSTHPLPAGQVRYNNNGTMQFGGGTLTTFDNRNVPDSLKYRFVLQVNVDSVTRIATGRWYWQSGNELLDPDLPEGKHQVWWSVEDDCGNEAVCTTPFVVQDGLPPVISCRDTVEVIIGPDGLGVLEAESLLAGAPSDNYTPEPYIELGVNTGTPSGFPLDANGQPVDSLVFGCSHAPHQLVHLWARDEQGNAGFCSTIVLIDSSVHCFFQPFQLGGVVKTFGNRAIAGVVTYVDAGDPITDVAASPTEQDGLYAAGFSASGVNFTLIPSKTDAAINGVSTLDLVLINSHILNIQPFDTPYKTIAADANNSKTVTTADIGVLRRLILGISDTLPGQRAWLFVDSAFVFQNPDNPFAPAYPQTKLVINPPGDQLWHNFVGIKIGDVNDNADVDSLLQQQVDDREPLLFNLEDQYVEKGEIFNLRLAPQTAVTACQFTLDYPGFECLGITPDAGLTPEHAAVCSEKNKLTFSNDVGEKTGFNLHLRALESGFLSEKIKISDAITPAEAWSESGESLLPQLVFRKNDATASLTAQPNLFTDQTVLAYVLPSETKAEMLVYNAAGQLLMQQTVPGTAGEHKFVLHVTMLNNAVGTLVVQLKTTTEIQTVKLVRH